MKNIKKIIAVLLCLSIVMLCGCNTENKPENTEPEPFVAYGFKFPTEVYDNVSVEDFFLYSGEYPEDGSFEECENVVALKVKNNSATDIQLLRINVTADSKVLEFEITSLLAGATVIVLEKSKQTIAENEKISLFECVNRADYSENVTLKEGELLVKGNLGTINIQNISGTKIESSVYVYYKKTDADGNYFGGITFRTKADGIGADEIKQVPALNFDPNNSEVLFVEYAG